LQIFSPEVTLIGDQVLLHTIPGFSLYTLIYQSPIESLLNPANYCIVDQADCKLQELLYALFLADSQQRVGYKGERLLTTIFPQEVF